MEATNETLGGAPPILGTRSLGAILFLLSGSLVVYELLLVRLFAVTLIVHLANLAIALALLGIGFGATALHLWPTLVPAGRLGPRLGVIAVAQGAAVLGAVVLLLRVPLTVQWEDARDLASAGLLNDHSLDLLHTGRFIAVLPGLMLPFFFGGLGFSAIFKHARDRIGRLYAADLWGGAFGGALFLPLLGLMGGPDTVFAGVAMALAAAALSLWGSGRRRAAAVTGFAVLAILGAIAVVAAGHEILKIRYTWGVPERFNLASEWTSIARLRIVVDPRNQRQSLLLDTSSASEIIRSKTRLYELARSPARSLAFRLADPRKPIAVIAASAGNEVALAQHFGFRDITALDIVGRGFDLVRERYRDLPINPYLQKGVRTLDMDGRAGILHSPRRYALIVMRWANLNNAAGVLSNAWSPSLLETREAFVTYLRHLLPAGMVAFSKGGMTRAMVPSAAAALTEIGYTRPYAHMAIVTGIDGTVLLVRRKAFGPAGAARLREVVRQMGGRFILDPRRAPTERFLSAFGVLTDDRPYQDTPRDLWGGLERFFEAEGSSTMMQRVNFMMWVQFFALAGAGLVFLGVPLVFRGRRDLANVRGTWVALLYAAAIGYAYLAIETVLIHDLVVFLGHPTYAVTLVVLVLLLGSGFGSTRVGSMSPDRLQRRLTLAILLLLAFAAIQALVLPHLYSALLVGTPLALRVFVVGATMLPLGYFMGMPFPLALRILPAGAGEVVPWMWAINGWMSVVAAMSTVFFARQLGFTVAFAVAGVFYVLALLVSGRLARVGAQASAA